MKTFLAFVIVAALHFNGHVSGQLLVFATQNQINALQSEIDTQAAQIASLQSQIAAVVSKGAVPAGYIYLQLSFQSPPSVLFPQYSWLDVTSSYAGLFFRAAGGDAAAVNTTQAYSSPVITSFAAQNTAGFPNSAWPNSVTVSNGANSNLFVSTGGYALVFGTSDSSLRTDGLNFVAQGYGMENRPVNQAINIWQRQ